MSCSRVLGFAAESTILHSTRNATGQLLRASALRGLGSVGARRPSAWREHDHEGSLQRSIHLSRSHSQQWETLPPQPPSTHPSGSSASQLLPERLRSLMRLLTHSVVVCTSSDTSTAESPVPRAMTMSSFTSLALAPKPLVTFNIATPSRSLSAVESSGRFNIHILAGDVDGSRVADWFTRGNAGGKRVFEDLEVNVGCRAELNYNTHNGSEGTGDVSGRVGVGLEGREPPILRGAGVLYVLRCKVLGEAPGGGFVKVGGHVIVVGEVEEILDGSDGASRDLDSTFGLVYADRRYRRLGEVMAKAPADKGVGDKQEESQI